MNFFFDKGIRLAVILIAIITGIILVYYFIKPLFLEPFGFLNSRNFLRIMYKTNGNTALIYISPINRWILYNEGKAYTYTPQNTGRMCDKKGFSLAYVLDPKTSGEGVYECIPQISNIEKEYYQSEWRTIFHRIDFNKDISEQILTTEDIINILLKRKIIFD